MRRRRGTILVIASLVGLTGCGHKEFDPPDREAWAEAENRIDELLDHADTLREPADTAEVET